MTVIALWVALFGACLVEPVFSGIAGLYQFRSEKDFSGMRILGSLILLISVLC